MQINIDFFSSNHKMFQTVASLYPFERRKKPFKMSPVQALQTTNIQNLKQTLVIFPGPRYQVDNRCREWGDFKSLAEYVEIAPAGGMVLMSILISFMTETT